MQGPHDYMCPWEAYWEDTAAERAAGTLVELTIVRVGPARYTIRDEPPNAACAGVIYLTGAEAAAENTDRTRVVAYMTNEIHEYGSWCAGGGCTIVEVTKEAAGSKFRGHQIYYDTDWEDALADMGYEVADPSEVGPRANLGIG